MKTSIQLLPTNKPYLFKIQLFLNNQVRQIAKLDTRNDGTLFIIRSARHLFRKTNSLAVNFALLHDSSIKFKHIQISYMGKKFYSTREYFIKNGQHLEFSSKGLEHQLSVPLDKLNINVVKRFEDSNWTQQDFFYQFS